ncbi:MAG: 4-(cytidine 5'-diphospho)-2-C-methyl-D-erythritol kinase [Bacteroidales bacterium]
MISFPNAKVNIGLYITQKRPDGFHNIETVFLPIPNLCDILEIIPTTNQNRPLKFSQSGLQVDSHTDDNLCVKAHYLISQKTFLPNVAIHLHKQIPMGAGLGGGSADGAFALEMLNNIAEEPLLSTDLANLALKLGSDCPFFLTNKPSLGAGQGELLKPISLDLNGHYIALVNPAIHVNTGEAYKQSKPAPAKFNLETLSDLPVERWKDHVENDFERVVFPKHPLVKSIKDQLYSMGAAYASMSGSGSTVFGIFKNYPNVSNYFRSMFTHVSEL